MKRKKNGMLSAHIIDGDMMSLIISVLLTMVVTSLVLSGRIGERLCDGLMHGVWFVAAAIGIAVGGRGECVLRAWVRIFIGGAYAIALILAGCLLFEGSFYMLWISLLLITAGGIAAVGFPAVSKRKNRHRSLTR